MFVIKASSRPTHNRFKMGSFKPLLNNSKKYPSTFFPKNIHFSISRLVSFLIFERDDSQTKLRQTDDNFQGRTVGGRWVRATPLLSGDALFEN